MWASVCKTYYRNLFTKTASRYYDFQPFLALENCKWDTMIEYGENKLKHYCQYTCMNPLYEYMYICSLVTLLK